MLFADDMDLEEMPT